MDEIKSNANLLTVTQEVLNVNEEALLLKERIQKLELEVERTRA